MTSFREGSLRLACLGLALAAAVLCTRPGDAAAAEGERFATLKEAIEAGALEPYVVDADRDGTALNGFIILAETNPDERSSAEAKREVADRQAGFAVIRDYEHLPLTFVRFED